MVAVGLIRGGGDDDRARPWSLPSGTLTPAADADTGANTDADSGADIDANSRPDNEPDRDELPSSGPGTFTYEQSTGPILGAAGSVKRFHLAVESNLDADLPEFGQLTDSTLADRRGWTSDKKQRFQRVPKEAPADFKIALVTRETAHRLCQRVGLDIRVDGVPYTSCQANGWVVINLDRWHLSVPDYVSAGTPLLTYRQYVINHEVGHQLGRVHEECPGPGKLAPVMQQQTLGLEGCVANPWPYPNAVT
ncbi:MAG TPA: DUF3152 domain-containing protein [Candidatus Limnocylindrales bacterium]